ncbi:dUTP diphosphatase, partial [Burkholderia multivorans]
AIHSPPDPFGRRVVPTGIAIALPAGHAGFVHPRSGLSSRHGVTVVNAPGTIDSGYRGEVKVPLINLDPKVPMRISRGDRIAQLIIQEVRQADFRVVDSLDDSD